MDYEKQRAFLLAQAWRVVPAGLGCGLLLFEVLGNSGQLWARLLAPPTAGLAALLAVGLLWSAGYLPNYLCLSAVAWRRLRWAVRARWFLGALMLLIAAAFQAWTAAAIALVLLTVHFPLGRRLVRALPADPIAAAGKRLLPAALAYSLLELAWLHTASRGGVSPILLVEFLMAFAFFAAVFARPRALASQLAWAAGAAVIAFAFTGAPLLSLAAFLWTFATAWLLARADSQNEENFKNLVETLQVFNSETQETIVTLLAESTGRLAEDWNRAQPQGPAEVAAWYSRNARYYLYDIAQHHLLYKHIVYTLALVDLARRCAPGGRVLDFGGGNGDFSCALARAGFDTTYLDVPGEAAEFVRWRAEREGLKLAIAHDAAALSGPFDLVFSLDVLEHLVEVKPTLDRWAALLRPGGWLVFTYYTGATSSGPMHIDPGFDVPAYLVAQGFRDVKGRHVGLLSPDYMRKKQFVNLQKKPSNQ